MITLYSSVVYGILYLIFFAYPYAFQFERGWREDHAALPFLGMLVGSLLGCVSVAIEERFWWLPRYLLREGQIHPEDRLLPMIVSAILLPAGLLWFAWTSNSAIPWSAQVPAGILIGAGIVLNVLASTAYLLDVYHINASSAIAALVCVRSTFGAAFPSFSLPMYKALGTAWATTLLGLLCVILAPCPWIFMKYGMNIRSRSRYSIAEKHANSSGTLVQGHVNEAADESKA